MLSRLAARIVRAAPQQEPQAAYMFRKALRTVLHDYGWIHMSAGLAGKLAFLTGSILLLPGDAAMRTVGIWLFIAGSSLMAVDAVGQLLVEILNRK